MLAALQGVPGAATHSGATSGHLLATWAPTSDGPLPVSPEQRES